MTTTELAATSDATTPHPGRTVTSGLAIALVSAGSFGLSGPLARSLLDLGWTPAAVVAIRITGAFALLVIPCALSLRRTGLPSMRQSGRLLLYGMVAVAGAQLCYFSAVQRLSVGVALLLEYLAPVLLILWTWASSRRRPAVSVFVGALLSLLGLAFVLDLPSVLKSRGGATLDPVGVLWGLGAALCLCCYFVLSQSSGDGAPIPPLLLTTVGLGVGGLVIVGLGAVGVLPLAARTGSTALAGASIPWWLPVLLLVTVSAVFAYLTGIIAVRRLGTSVASFVSLSEVLFAVVFAIVLLDQQPTGTQLVGGVLVLAGIAVVQRGSARPRGRSVQD
ncbi:DMT family transporter [uncultured Friedmanniella sp.]|uniref:EamA family transporter n=1 Tax=uncultured Friedmanniella sp. TaxID=335381 RepID=UPI0035CB7049